jgi:hypothetical protein
MDGRGVQSFFVRDRRSDAAEQEEERTPQYQRPASHGPSTSMGTTVSIGSMRCASRVRTYKRGAVLLRKLIRVQLGPLEPGTGDVVRKVVVEGRRRVGGLGQRVGRSREAALGGD